MKTIAVGGVSERVSNGVISLGRVDWHSCWSGTILLAPHIRKILMKQGYPMHVYMRSHNRPWAVKVWASHKWARRINGAGWSAVLADATCHLSVQNTTVDNVNLSEDGAVSDTQRPGQCRCDTIPRASHAACQAAVERDTDS